MHIQSVVLHRRREIAGRVTPSAHWAAAKLSRLYCRLAQLPQLGVKFGLLWPFRDRKWLAVLARDGE